MLVNVEEGELLAGFAGLEVRPLQHDDQPLLLLLGNLENRCLEKFSHQQQEAPWEQQPL